MTFTLPDLDTLRTRNALITSSDLNCPEFFHRITLCALTPKALATAVIDSPDTSKVIASHFSSRLRARDVSRVN